MMTFACWRCVKRNVVNPGDLCVPCDDHLAKDRPARSVSIERSPTTADIESASLRHWQELTGN